MPFLKLKQIFMTPDIIEELLDQFPLWEAAYKKLNKRLTIVCNHDKNIVVTYDNFFTTLQLIKGLSLTLMACRWKTELF